MSDMRNTIRLLAARPNGVRACDAGLEAFKRHAVECALVKMVKAGELFKARISHKVARYYADQATAEREQARFSMAGQTRISRPVAVRLDPSLPVVVPAHVKVTMCPSHPPRYQALVGAIEFGLQRGRVTR